MALVTLRILDGPERGKAFHQIATPVTIGREEGNFIQLNDERVSRYHLKIHENGGDILLTDLQSTNGTKVNGEVVQIWHLRPGDVVSAGRSVMIFGSTEEIAIRLAELSQENLSNFIPMGVDGEEFQFLDRSFETLAKEGHSSALFEIEIFRGLSPEELAPLHLLSPPSPPTGLPPKQAAQITEYLQYIQLRLRYLVSSVRVEADKAKSGEESSGALRVTLSADQWQNILDLYSRISSQLNHVGEP